MILLVRAVEGGAGVARELMLGLAGLEEREEEEGGERKEEARASPVLDVR